MELLLLILFVGIFFYLNSRSCRLEKILSKPKKEHDIMFSGIGEKGLGIDREKMHK
jgi:hypothetical protein